MGKIVSDEFRKALPRLIEVARAAGANTKEFEIVSGGFSATCHIVHLGEKLLQALNELDNHSRGEADETV